MGANHTHVATQGARPRFVPTRLPDSQGPLLQKHASPPLPSRSRDPSRRVSAWLPPPDDRRAGAELPAASLSPF
jgi:hypothetical protein